MPLLLYLLLAVACLLFGYLKYKHSYWKRRDIPHDEPEFFKGNIGEGGSTKHFSYVFGDTYMKYKGSGPFAGFYFLTMKLAVLLDQQLIKNVLIRDFHNFDERGLFHNEIDDPLTGNLFFLDGDKWRTLRNKMSPTFTSGKMKFMFETVSKVGVELLSAYSDKVGPQGNVLEVTDLLARFTADVIGSCAFGLECNSLRNPEAEFVKMGKSFLKEPRHNKLANMLLHSNPKLARKLHMRLVPDKVHDFYMRIVRETVTFREKNKVKRNDFMDMLIELKNRDNDALSMDEVAAQAFVFFLAGFDTSATTMAFALYELARHQDIQDKARAEVQSVLAKHNQVFSYECMKEMQYLEMIYSETLRIHPVVGHLVRRARQRYETNDPKYYIDEGTLVIIPLFGIHFDHEYYPEPEKFDPERFTAEAIQQRPACTWLPFGDGPRNCIGMRFGKMQMSIGLAFLLNNYRFSVAPETQIPVQTTVESLTIGPVNGIHLKVERI